MLLMVARLGLRASDIKSMPVSDVGWSARTISITQHKTGVAPGLPLLDDIGWAVIDYLREGRPKAATCPQLFVRQVAPFDAFGATANLTNILIRRARGAGIRAPRDHRAPRPLRHALAKRLLEQEVPTGDISRILGHVDRRTTGTCPRTGVDSLSACAPGCPEDELPRALVEARAARRPGESETTGPCRAGRARGPADRMMRAGYDACVAPGRRGCADRGAHGPHILADAELASLFSAAEAIAGGDPASWRAQAARGLRWESWTETRSIAEPAAW